MNRRLRSLLLTIGRAAGARSGSGGIRFFALALASLSLALTLAAVIAALAVETARDGRMSDGQLIPAAESAPSGEVTLVKMVIDHLREGRQYTVVFLSPRGENSPLPPGLAEWPQPGTAVVSPELRREGAEQGITERYGDIAGSISGSGLADATELLVYVRPVQDLTAAQSPDVVAVSGFGGSLPPVPFQNVHWLLANQDSLAGTLTWLLALFGVGPSLLLALVASRVASHSRDRRNALITALGGRTALRVWIAIGEAWGPVLLGVFVATGAIAWFATADRRLPIVDYVVTASDIRGHWWAFGLCAVAAAALVLCATVLQGVIGAVSLGRGRSLKGLGRRTRTARAASFPWFVLLAAWGPYLLSDGHPARVLIGYAGLVGIVLTLPAAIGGGVAAMGRWLTRWGHRRRPVLLAAGARMVHQLTAVAQHVYGVCVGIVILLFALTMQSNLAAGAAEADAFIDEHGYSLVEVHPRGQVTATEVSDFDAAVSEDIELVAYTQSTPEGDESGSFVPQIQVTGTCLALESLALPCPAEGHTAQVDTAEGVLAAWLGGAGLGTGPVLMVASGPPSSAVVDESIALLAFTTSGDDITASALHNAGVVFPFGVATGVPGESWYTGAVPHLEQSGWIVLIGGFGLVILILAAGLGLAGEFLRFGRAIAPLPVLAGNRRIYWRAAALFSLLPMTAAVGGSLVVGYLAVRPMIPTGVNLVTPTFVMTVYGAALVTGMIMWWWSAAAASGPADRWRPGRGGAGD